MAERALWAGPGVHLRAGAVGVVEFALHPGGYVRFEDDDYLLVAIPRAPRGPLSLLVTGLHKSPLSPGDRAEITADELRVGALRVDLTRLATPVHATPAHAVAGPAHLAPPAHAVAAPAHLAAALAAAPAPPASLRPGLRALSAGDLPAALACLAGRGEGLTPAGDDVLAGFAAARHRAGRPVSFDASRCSPLGRAYLRCAERGQLPEDLSRWGSSSGTAMLWGMGAAA